MVRLSAPNTPRDSRRGWPASGDSPSSGTGAREGSDRELIATSPPEAPRSREEAMRLPGGIGRVKASRQFRGHSMDRWRGRSTAVRIAILGLLASSLTAVALTPSVTSAQAATSCPAGGCTVTVNGLDFSTKDPLTTYNFVVNVDNTKLPSDPLSLSTESNSPIVAEGDQAHPTVLLPAGRYLISMRSLDHKMWGNYLTLPDAADASGSVTVNMELTTQSADHPLPLGKIRVFVFNDNAWTNGAPDTEEAGLGGFQVG